MFHTVKIDGTPARGRLSSGTTITVFPTVNKDGLRAWFAMLSSGEEMLEFGISDEAFDKYVELVQDIRGRDGHGN